MEYSPVQNIIKSNLFELRTFLESDLESYLNFLRRNKEHLRSTGPRYNDNYFTESYWRARFKDYFNTSHSERFFIHKDNLVIGEISASHIIRGSLSSASFGYKLDQEYMNKGIMSEATKLAVNYFFKQMNLHRLQAGFMQHNRASGRILEKLGFQKIGLAKQYLKINGRYEDHILTQLINTDFKDTE